MINSQYESTGQFLRQENLKYALVWVESTNQKIRYICGGTSAIHIYYLLVLCYPDQGGKLPLPGDYVVITR